MLHEVVFYKSDGIEGMFKLLPNGCLGKCYLLRSSADDCIEITCLPVTAKKILDYFNSGISEERWQLFDMFDYEYSRKEEK